MNTRREQRSFLKLAHQSGVTLVEVLIALLIVGLAASVVVLNGPSANQTAKQESERFAARLKAASSEAIITGEVIGLDLYHNGYRFMRYRRGDWIVAEGRVLGAWQLQDRISMIHEITEAISLKDNDKIIARSGSAINQKEKERFIPPVQFNPLGNDTPFDAVFTDGDIRWRVSLSADGDVEVTRDATS